RLLETDSKSLRSVNGSRRNSGSSLVSSSSASSNLSHLEEDSWILWGRIVNEWEDVRKKKEKQVKVVVGHYFVGYIFIRYLASFFSVRHRCICLPAYVMCSILMALDPLQNLLPVYRGILKEDLSPAFHYSKRWKLGDNLIRRIKIVFRFGTQNTFSSWRGITYIFFFFLFQEHLPELYVHFQSQSFHTSMYASSWFLTIFLTTFPLPIATRIFDIFMSEGLEIVFRVGLAVLQMNQAELLQLDMEGMLQHFQKVIPHQFDNGPDKLIQASYQVKYNAKKMKKLEKEYTTIKTKEMEEQVEIK
ncbi:Ecotropic viral integration site 5 protein, partial [Tyto alba]